MNEYFRFIIDYVDCCMENGVGEVRGSLSRSFRKLLYIWEDSGYLG